MRWLINYIKQCFCKHKFEFVKGTTVRIIHNRYAQVSHRYDAHPVTYHICKHCGYSRMFWV